MYEMPLQRATFMKADRDDEDTITYHKQIDLKDCVWNLELKTHKPIIKKVFS